MSLSHRKSWPIFHRYRTDFSLSLCYTPTDISPIYHRYRDNITIHHFEISLNI